MLNIMYDFHLIHSLVLLFALRTNISVSDLIPYREIYKTAFNLQT